MSKQFFSRNLDRKGRAVRGAMALALCVGAWFAFKVSPWLGVGLGGAGVFALFEALRGWCVLRACGVKTRL